MVRYVLALDGGGVKGVIVLRFLQKLEEERGIKVSDFFDMFVGTSTGALICSLFAHKSISAKEILDNMYTQTNLATIMYQSYYNSIMNVFYTRAKYCNKNKMDVVSRYLCDKDTRMCDVPKPILITAYNPEKKEPIFFSNFLDRNSQYKLLDACNASTAAPVYFPAAVVECPEGGEDKILIDGGIFSNNPACFAYLNAKKMYPDEEVRVLSIGTGIKKSTFSPKYKNGGGYEWVIDAGVIDMMFDGNQLSAHLEMKRMTDLNRDTYLRVNEYLQYASYEMDDTSKNNYDLLLKEGDEWWKIHKNDPFVKLIGCTPKKLKID